MTIMIKTYIIPAVVALLVVFGYQVVTAPSNTFAGKVETVKTTFGKGFESLATSSVSSGFTVGGDATVSGGTLNVTTANSATSTLVVGCIQFYATSTATAHKFQASTTPGNMVSQYGSCPNL